MFLAFHLEIGSSSIPDDLEIYKNILAFHLEIGSSAREMKERGAEIIFLNSFQKQVPFQTKTVPQGNYFCSEPNSDLIHKALCLSGLEITVC